MIDRLVRATVIAGWLLGLPLSVPAEQLFRIELHQDGVYQLTFESLQQAGLGESVDIHSFSLSNRDQPVPIWVHDEQNNGRFDPGDHLSFIGQHPSGAETYFHEYSPLNVYWLSVSELSSNSIEEVQIKPEKTDCCANFLSRRHVEQDRLFAPLDSSLAEREPEFWYWSKFSHASQAPFAYQFDASDIAQVDDLRFKLKLSFLGWSDAVESTNESLTDHQVIVSLNDIEIGRAAWNDKRRHLLEIDEVPASAIKAGSNRLTVSIPRRQLLPSKNPLIDIIYLDWIELEYQRSAHVNETVEQARIIPLPSAGSAMQLTSSSGDLAVFTENGRQPIVVTEKLENKEGFRHQFNSDPSAFWIVQDDQFLSPAAVSVSGRANLKARDWPIDYLILSHSSLSNAIVPLADFHRSRGVRVEVVEIDAVYDSFSGGLVDPAAIRDFLTYLRLEAATDLRWVLLVGDASWYTKAVGDNAENRNLIPAWKVVTPLGPAASDGRFADIQHENMGPDLAIGRIPVITPEELSGIVNKTIAYMEQPMVGPWRRHALLINDLVESHQQRSQYLIERAQGSGYLLQGFSSDRLSKEQRLAEVRGAFDQGRLLVHFYGHGGRYMWQTGAGNVRETESFFDLEQLDLLQPSRRLPLVLSLTCNSGPFDHPSADSLAEKLLRMPDKGAIAVLAASARNSPNRRFSRALMEAMLQPGTIGELVMQVKQGFATQGLDDLYNLFGDPALEIARPAHHVELTLQPDQAQIEANVAIDGFDGKAIIDWLDAHSRVIESQRLEQVGQKLTLPVPDFDQEQPAFVKIYAWNEQTGVDALGEIAIE